MAATTEPRPDIDDVVPGKTPPPGDPATAAIPVVPTDDGDEGGDAADRVSPRIAVAVAFPVIACAVMVGGIFKGASPRFYAAIAGLLGIALAYGLAKIKRQTALSNILAFAGLFVIGLLMVTPNFGNVMRLREIVAEASQQGDVLRPPVDFVAGWKPVVGWLMGIIAFISGWVALTFKKPAIALLLPLPLAAFAGISVPDNAQVASGIAVLVLFAIGLGILSSEQSVADGDDESASPPLAYELRKAAKAVPLLVAITVALFFLSKTNVLFPDPVIDPAQEPQKPKTQPLSEAEDRVLFEVESDLTGPWRIGSLDVYDGQDWRLPPFAQSELEEVPRSGIVDTELTAGVRATFTVAGLGGAVLPVLPNTVGVVAEGPKLAYDSRNANIRLVSGQVTPGQRYTVTAAALPSIDDLRKINVALPKDVEQFTEIGPVPAAVQSLIDQAPKDSKWDTFDYLRTWVLENVTASGTGTPKSIDADRVEDMISGSKKGSPFEIVAAQAMLARWIGVPSRIGYGFDGGEKIDGKLQVRPTNGAAFVEVYFPNYKWLPVIGTPKKAEPTVGSDPTKQKTDPNILPSEDVAVQVFLPTVIPPQSIVAKQIGVTVLVATPILLAILLAYVLYPAVVKARRRSRRRELVLQAGIKARVANAYCEWRDYATDFGFLYPTDTPLMFLDRFIEDDEHTELAWLTTRVLWGDLQDDPRPILATVAEELSRSLRRRLAASQPATMRAVAFVSRLSLRDPYGPEVDAAVRPVSRKERKREAVPA